MTSPIANFSGYFDLQLVLPEEEEAAVNSLKASPIPDPLVFQIAELLCATSIEELSANLAEADQLFQMNKEELEPEIQEQIKTALKGGMNRLRTMQEEAFRMAQASPKATARARSGSVGSLGRPPSVTQAFSPQLKPRSGSVSSLPPSPPPGLRNQPYQFH